MSATLLTALLVFVTTAAHASKPRMWTDSTGKYTFEADLIGQSDDMVVLQRTNKEKDLVAMPVDKLSKMDQEYLKSKEVAESVRRAADQKQTWTMHSGLKVIGRVVEYGRRNLTIQRRRGKIYVNDRLLSNFPDLQQKMLPKIVAHFEQNDIEDEKDLDTWVITKLKGEAVTYTVEGVILELENGDEYGVPFFFFSQDDLKVLEPGWQRWLAADNAREKEETAKADKERESFMLQAQAQAYQRDRQINQQMKMMELELLATAAGATDLWEVHLYPGRGVAGYPRVVVVPGKNSADAKRIAMQRFPGYTAGAVAQANRPF
jgi:hypothetical protein